MKVGLIMTVAVPHSMQEEAWTFAKRNSRPDTPFIVLFNGIPAMEVPEGVERIFRRDPFTDEADLWQWGLELAQERGWDWCMFIHDDFKIVEPGWEDELEASAGWRVALASWLGYMDWDIGANTSRSTPHRLAVGLDSMAFGFNVHVFKRRGTVCATRFGFGYGAWDAQAWALSQGYAIWRIMLNSDHQWRQDNTRTKLARGADGHPWFKDNWQSVLPSHVIDERHISVAGDLVKIAPHADTPVPPKVDNRRYLSNALNYMSKLVVDTETGESAKVDAVEE